MLWYIAGIVASAAILFLAGVAAGLWFPLPDATAEELAEENGKLKARLRSMRLTCLKQTNHIGDSRGRALGALAYYCEVEDLLDLAKIQMGFLKKSINALVEQPEVISGDTEDRS